MWAAVATSWLAAALSVWAVEWAGAPWWGVLTAMVISFGFLTSLYTPKVTHVIQATSKP